MTLLEFPLETAEQIRLGNVAYGVNRNIEFRVASDAYSLRLVAAAPGAASALSFEITSDKSGRLWVSLADTAALNGFSTWLGDSQLENLPTNIAAIVLDTYLAPLLEQVGGQVGESLTLTNVRIGQPPEDLPKTLSFLLATDDGDACGCFHFEENWSATIKSLLSFVAPDALEECDSLRLPAFVELGRTSLTLAEIGALDVDDVVMFDHSGLFAQQQVELCLPPRVRIPCAVGEECLIVAPFSDEQLAPLRPPVAAPGAMDNVRVSLSAQAGHVELTIEQIGELDAGDELAYRGAEVVDIVIAGQAVGKGELVRAGERLGVRLTAMTRPLAVDVAAQLAEDEQEYAAAAAED